MDRPDALLRIHRLPAVLADRIAAGEVVERPASVVKELVENSFDAGADRIEVRISRGGMDAIVVTDNGHGIHPDDLALALERHATSKIRSQSDLDAILTLGFRGEALPSIASVAGLKLVSRMRDQPAARAIEFIGESPELRPAAHPPGTTVEVLGLFRHLPARRRFLRSERTEYLHVLELVKRLALSRPHVNLRLLHNDRLVLNCPAAGSGREADRVGRILGAGFTRNAHQFEIERGDLRVHGWLGNADAARSQSDQQYFFLNGRLIRDRQVSHALRVGYGDRVQPGRFPGFVVYMTMNAAEADVNVHPTKHEVRFRRARDIHDFLAAAVREGLAGDHPAPVPAPNQVVVAAVTETASRYRAHHPAPRSSSLGRVVARLGDRYALAERDGAVFLIDMRALCRAWFRQRLQQERAAGPLRPRPLLVPVEVTVTRPQIDAFERHSDSLQSFGFSLQCVAPGRVGVRAVPVLLEAADLPVLITDMSKALANTSGPSVADRLEALVLEHGTAAEAARPPAESLEMYLPVLEQSGMDFTAPHRTGLWRRLDAADIRKLIGGDD